MSDKEQALELVREARRLRREATLSANAADANERIIEAKRMEMAACSLFLEQAEEWLR